MRPDGGRLRLEHGGERSCKVSGTHLVLHLVLHIVLHGPRTMSWSSLSSECKRLLGHFRPAEDDKLYQLHRQHLDCCHTDSYASVASMLKAVSALACYLQTASTEQTIINPPHGEHE